MAKKGRIWDEDGTTTNPGDAEFEPNSHLKQFNEEQRRFLEEVQKGSSIRKACEAAGVTRYGVEKWKQEKNFNAAFAAAQEDRVDNIEDKAFEAAQEGHWPAIQKILESHRFEIYGPKSKHDINLSAKVFLESMRHAADTLRDKLDK